MIDRRVRSGGEIGFSTLLADLIDRARAAGHYPRRSFCRPIRQHCAPGVARVRTRRAPSRNGLQFGRWAQPGLFAADVVKSAPSRIRRWRPHPFRVRLVTQLAIGLAGGLTVAIGPSAGLGFGPLRPRQARRVANLFRTVQETFLANMAARSPAACYTSAASDTRRIRCCPARPRFHSRGRVVLGASPQPQASIRPAAS